MADQDQASKDAAMKQRIIKHMNADHQASISYYLRHYKQLSTRQSRSPILSDISFSAMDILTIDGKTHSIPFDPPMKSWSEARMRTVEMDREAREGLDISSIRITSYEPPSSVPNVAVFFLCVFAFVVFLTQKKIVPGTWFYDNILPYYPGGPKVFLWLADKIALPVLGIHCFETFLLDRTRLRKYGVERGTRLWWMWIGSCFLEGYGCFQRIDATVERKKLEAEKAKH